MTYRTNDTDNTLARSAAGTSAPVRHLRRRRRALALNREVIGILVGIVVGDGQRRRTRSRG